MTRFLSVFLIVFMVLVGCSKEEATITDNKGVTITDNESPHGKLSHQINEVLDNNQRFKVLIKAKVVDGKKLLVTIENQGTIPIDSGTGSGIYEGYKEGEWYLLKFDPERSSSGVGITIDPKDSRTLELDIGYLPKGKYRIIKKVTINPGTVNKDTRPLAISFQLEK